jgi:HD superfamily phosphohydrolase
MTNATTLRTLVIDNRFNDKRLTEAQVGKDSLKVLTTLYRGALDAITEWASKDYAHTSTNEDHDAAFNAVKKILSCYTTKDDKIIIDETSMRTIRDLSTKITRMYSDEYKTAKKALAKANSTLADREKDLIEKGAPKKYIGETNSEWLTRVKALELNTKVGEIDLLELYENALSICTLKEEAVKTIEEAGNYTWRGIIPQTLPVFADCVEGYIADCLIDGHNLKSSKKIREEKAEAKKAAKAEA